MLIDDIDTLVGDTLISVLRQLRAGYNDRSEHFPQSVILCGVRDVRDYRIHSSAERTVITGGSAFNIEARSLRLGDFSETEVRALLAQHTEETGQAFTPNALEMVWEQTRGQPWLVNGLADEACFRNRSGRDRTRAIDADDIRRAREQLLAAFQAFFREHAEHWVGRFDYREAGPQLLLQAFLQRIVNGGGYVEREYGLGRGRVDLLIVWPQGGRQRRFVVECKVVHKGLERTIREGVAQTVRYLERSAAESGHLVVFDRGAGSWDEKIFRREQQAGGRRIVVWGM